MSQFEMKATNGMMKNIMMMMMTNNLQKKTSVLQKGLQKDNPIFGDLVLA